MKRNQYSLKRKAEIIEVAIAKHNWDISIHREVISFPLTDAKDGYDFQGGIINSQNFDLIPEAIHLRHGKVSQVVTESIKTKIKSQPLQRINGTILFGGILFDNFGHFLLESLGRLWAYSYLKEYDPYLLFYAPWGTSNYKKRDNYIRQILDGFQIPTNRILILPEISQIETLIVPAQKYGFGICRKPDHHILSFLKSFQVPRNRRRIEYAEKIYVSRSKLSYSKGRPFGEELFEHYLQSNGYYILYPEKTTVYDQLRLYANAKNIIFCDGGATYATILMPDLNAQIAIIARRRDHRWNYKDITEHFHGFGKTVEWIDEIECQYEYGMESWDAAAEINWLNVSLVLKEKGFVTNIFTVMNSDKYQSTKKIELLKFIQSIEHNPRFLDYMEKNKVQHPLLPSEL